MNELQSVGIKVADDLNNIEENSIIIIRSHGVPAKIYNLANKKNIEIVDATCPYVRKIQNIVKKFKAKGILLLS